MPRVLVDYLYLVVGAVLALTGLVLLIGGIQLIWLGGSWFYAFAGAGLVVSGVLTASGRPEGVWLYLILFGVTFLWSLFEADGNLWAWVPRIVAPLILLLVAGALLPLRDRATYNWYQYGAGAGVLLAGFALGAASLYPTHLARSGAIPAAVPLAAPESAGEWTSYGADMAQRYAGLDQINRTNVDQLERAWVSHTGDLPADLKDNSYGAETTPLKVGNRLFLCSATNILLALDAATGEELWRHDPGVSDDWIPYTAACRGVAYHEAAGSGDGICRERIIEGTLDGRLIAVDAGSGLRCPDFGSGGAADIKTGMGEIVPGMVSMTSPPVIVDGVIVTGHQVLDGQKRDAPSGVIKGFDVITGDHLWSWDMTRPDIARLPPEGETFTRGTPNAWTIAAGDNALGLAYIPMGNSSVDYWSTGRSEPENTYATSLVALDVRSGRPAWHFQTVRKDVWDYDLGSQPTLLDFPGPQGTVPAILLPSKQGDLYVLDRRNGVLLTPAEDREVPQGGVEPEERTATQPFSLWHTLARPRLEERDMWGMTLIDQMLCRIQFRKAAYDGIYTPPTSERHWIQYPGYNGGSDWGSVAYDPRRGIIIANYNDMPNYNRLVPRAEADARGWAPRGEARGGDMGGAEGAGDPQIGAPYGIDVNAGWRMPVTGLLCKEPPYGGIRAIDVRTGETLWDRSLGTARRNGPFGIPSGLPLTIGTPNNGGPIATAGDVIFVAATTDNLIRAIDIETGRTLWQDVLPAGGQATPITYSVEGQQYLVLMTGGHHFMETPVGDQVIAWTLPASSHAAPGETN
jgi:quinoprotein glucose dehydrogenase